MDEVPTRIFSVGYYYEGRVARRVKSSGFADSYHKVLNIRQKAGEDPLLAEIRPPDRTIAPMLQHSRVASADRLSAYL